MSARDRVLAIVAELGEDEVEVLAEVATGLAGGRAVYGEMRVTGDARDFEREALDEARDGLVYVAAALIRARRERGPRIEIQPDTWSLEREFDLPRREGDEWRCMHGVGDRPCGRCFTNGELP